MTGTSNDQLVESAVASLEAGDFERARESSLLGLAERPDDPVLLHVAGRASAELGLDDAVGYLEAAAAADPSNVRTWRDLGDALAGLGRIDPAREAFRRAVELAPDDPQALLDVGLASLGAGRTGDAVAYLKQATQLDPTSVNAYRGLLEIHRRDGKLGEALTVAMRVEERLPDDPIATLDVAELCLALGRGDQSAAAFQRLRALDDDPEHEVYAYHGLIEVEIQRGHLAQGSRPGGRRDARSTGSGAPQTCSRSSSPRSSASKIVPARPGRRSMPSSARRVRSTGAFTRRPLLPDVAAPPRETAQVEWTKCPSCDAFVYHKRLRRNLGVCPECNFHFRLPVRQRLAAAPRRWQLRRAER